MNMLEMLSKNRSLCRFTFEEKQYLESIQYCHVKVSVSLITPSSLFIRAGETTKLSTMYGRANLKNKSKTTLPIAVHNILAVQQNPVFYSIF